MSHQPPPTAPNMRSFGLNSAYAHALLTIHEPSALPIIPPMERPQVIIDLSASADPAPARRRRR